MNVATSLGDCAAPFCRRAGTTPTPRVVPARRSVCSTAPLSVTRALWQQLVIELLHDDLGSGAR